MDFSSSTYECDGIPSPDGDWIVEFEYNYTEYTCKVKCVNTRDDSLTHDSRPIWTNCKRRINWVVMWTTPQSFLLYNQVDNKLLNFQNYMLNRNKFVSYPIIERIEYDQIYYKIDCEIPKIVIVKNNKHIEFPDINIVKTKFVIHLEKYIIMDLVAIVFHTLGWPWS